MNVISRELRLYKRSGVWLIGLITPFILVICLGVAITGTVNNVPVGLVSSNDTIAAQINQIYKGDSSINLQKISPSNLNNDIISGKLRAVIEVNSVKGNNVSITIFVDSTDTAIKQQVQYTLSSILYQDLGKDGYLLTLRILELYSGKSFFAYLIPSILVIGPVLGGLFGATDTILNEKEDKTLENVIIVGFSPIKFTIQKILSFFLTTSITLVLTFTLAVMLADSLPSIPQIILSFILVFLTAFIFVSFGFSLSTYLPNKEIAGTIGGTIMFPILFISGAFLSVYAMESFIIPLAKINPLTICIEALRTILLKNGSFNDIIQNISLLALMSFLIFLFAVYRMNKIINAMQN